MVEDFKVHQGKKKEVDDFAQAFLDLAGGLKEQGFDDEFIYGALVHYASIFSSQGSVAFEYVEV